MRRVITIDMVRELFGRYGYEVLEDEFINAKHYMVVRCKNGHITEKAWDQFEKRSGCLECMGRKRKTIEELRLFFENEGYELLTTEYKGVKSKLDFICDRGHRAKITADGFVQGKRCKYCSHSRKKTTKEVWGMFSQAGYKVLDDEYKGVHHKVSVECDRGHVTAISTDKFSQGKRCAQCHREDMRGENHPNWNPKLTDKERLDKRDVMENKRWRDAVYKRDDYTCRKCGIKGGKLNAHHIFNYSTAKSMRFDLDNGITFCVTCHRKFHSIYSTRNNDEWQVKEFIGGDQQWNLININYSAKELCRK